jgi:sugar transferase (PEP-CTERM/EpsH1 system associated)
MKILWLNSGLLLPLDKGGRLRTWHLMRHLARDHQITYVSFADPDEDPVNISGMRAVCTRIETIPRRDPAKGSVRFYVDTARYLLNPLPYAVAKYRSREYQRRVQTLLERGQFDVVVCDFLFPTVNLPASLPCPSVLFTHNVESEIWRRHAETQTGRLQRVLLRTQWRRMLKCEAAAMARFDVVLAVSDADAATLRALYAPELTAPVHVVKTGVDTEFFAPEATAQLNPKHLVFTGSMDWLPNEDAILHFCDEILPLIRQAEPDVTFSVVGRAPTPAIRKLARDGSVEVTGRVDDVRPYVAPAGVYVVPLRIGGGTRLKIFEAMGMGKAIVSTSIGAEGLPVTHGRDIVIADEPRRFAEEVVRLMRDAEARRALELAARQLVVERYDWSAVASDLELALPQPVPPVPGEAARPRSVLICHRGAELDREGLSRWMGSFSNLAGIVELDEDSGRVAQRIHRQIRRAGIPRFADVLALRLFYKLKHARADREWEINAVKAMRRRFPELPRDLRVARLRSVNSPECVKFIRDCAPDFVVARCKTLLKPEVFTIPRAGTYVFHPGICPEYRNAHGCFWALVNRDLDRVGLTLLRIDAGVDTGPVYGYFTYAFDERAESHIRIQQRVLIENLDALRDRLLEAVAGDASAIDTTGRKSAVWGQPWLTAYARWKSAARRMEQDRYIHASASARADAAVPRRRS